MRSVVLVGLPGAGKTTIGRKLAQRLGRDFRDTDQLLEKRLGTSIGAIFRTRGEDYFRQQELDLFSELIKSGDGAVIATGGGIVKVAANRGLIVEQGIGVHIRASPLQVWKRLRHDTKRPLLQVDDPLAALERVHAERVALYREVAVLTLDAFPSPLASLVTDLAVMLRPFLDEADPGTMGSSRTASGSTESA